MKLLSLHANNFKKLKLKQPLNFPEGITLITGLNESGKSTILDAILYGLFGRMIRPNQKPSNEEIIGYGSGESQVRLEFAIGENKYRVVREVHKTRPNRAVLYEVKPDGKTKTIATTVNDTTSEVERLLGGITYNEIVASSVVAQKDLERLIKQRLDDRRKVINVFLNLDSFNRVQDELDEERVRIEGTTRTPGQLTMDRQQLEALRERQKDHRAKEAQLEGLAEKVKKLQVELRDLETKFADTDILYKTLSQYDEVAKRRESLETEVRDKSVLATDLKQQLSRISSQRSDLEAAESKLRDFETLQAIEPQLVKASKLLDRLRDQELRLGQLTDRETELTAEVAEKEKLSRSVKPLATDSAPSRNVWTYLAATGALGAGAILSFFLQLLLIAVALGSLAVVSLILLSRQIASLSQVADVSREKQEQLVDQQFVQVRKNELATAQRELAELTVSASESSRAVIQLLKTLPKYSGRVSGEDAKKAFDLTSALYAKDKQSQSALEERVKILREQLEKEPELNTRLEETEREIRRVRDGLSDIRLPELPEGLVFSEETLREASRYRDTLNEAVSRVRTQIEESVERQGELRRELGQESNLDETVDVQERKVRLHEKDLAVLKYSVKGIEQTSESLRNRVKPQVERYMGQILPVITSGHYKAVELDDDYTVKVFDPEAGEFKPKEVFSGGTEDQLLLAMRLAFALALIPHAKGKSPEFLFLDEPLGSSDRVRREGILALLRQELTQNFRQIFLISHVGDLEAEADTIIQMDNGTIHEVVSRKPSSPEPVQIPA